MKRASIRTFLASHNHAVTWFWLTMLMTLLLVLLVQLPLVFNPDLVDEDLRFFYWLYRFTDPSLFAGDPLLGYQFAEVNLGSTTLLLNKVSLLYGLLYASVSQIISPVLFTQLLAFPLALASSYFLFRISERITGPFVAFLICFTFTLIVTVSYSEMSLTNGLPRSFTLPILLAMLYFMLNQNDLGMVVVLVLSMLYPPTFLTVLITYAVKFALESLRQHRPAITAKQFTLFSIALFICFLLLLPAVLTGLNTVPGSPGEAAPATVFASPLFGNEGRYPLLRPSILTGNGGMIDRGVIGLYSLLFCLILIPAALLFGRQFQGLPPPFRYLALASVLGFLLSWAFILLTPSATFHMPSRYTRGTIFICGLILVFVNGPLVIQKLARLTGPVPVSGTPGKANPFIKRKSLNLFMAIMTLIVVFPLLLNMQNENKYYQQTAEAAELANYLRTLPPDTLISGYPCFLDDIPLYAQRAILFSCEIESRNFALMEATLDAYFAESEAEVLSFCREFNVSYMVGSQKTFTEEFRSQELILFEPLNSFLKQQLEGRSAFVLEQIPDNAKIFQNQSYYVFPCTAESLLSAG